MNSTGLVAMAAFKGTLTSKEACEAVALGLRQSGLQPTLLPVGDGGSGTFEAIESARGGSRVMLGATGPLGKPVEARALLFPNAEKPDHIFVESADTCGLALVPNGERDALRATSLGLGELLSTITSRWSSTLKRLTIGLGDSAVSDAGLGLLQALGFRPLDAGGRPLWPNGHSLRTLGSIALPAESKQWWRSISVNVLCDVLSPLCGSQGAAAIFSPQKGATPPQVRLLEEGMEIFAKRAFEITGKRIGLDPMTGACGGVAAALRAFLGARLVHGAPFLLDWIGFDEKLKGHGFLVTGEGRTDAQTLSGKIVREILSRTANEGKPSILLSGELDAKVAEQLKGSSLLVSASSGRDPSPREALVTRTRSLFSDGSLPAKIREATL